jgi:hypothetical protein
MCCGQKRATMTQGNVNHTVLNQTMPRSNSIATPARATAPAVISSVAQTAGAALAPAGWSSVGVRYLEKSPIRVRGPVTGIQYEFSAVNAVRSVDSRDAESLLGTRFFVKTG